MPTQTLSHAAQAVWEAFNQEEAGVFVDYGFVDYGDKLAAALRAAASHLTNHKAMNQLCAIAAELDGN